jgi:hypothetical protein
MNNKPASPAGRRTPQKASRAPHRKNNQAQERYDAAASRPGARECDPAGAGVPTGPENLSDPLKRPGKRHSTRCGFPPAGCPISSDIYLVLDLSEDLTRAMRQLRRKLDACEKCPLDDHCGFRRAFQEQVDLAIKEVTGEWGMP